MPLSPSLAVVLTLRMCIAGDQTDGPFADHCVTALSDSELAASFAGSRAMASPLSAARLIAEDGARDLMRQTGSVAGLAAGMTVSDAELQALLEAIHPLEPAASSAAPLSLFGDSRVFSSGGSSATITTEYRMGAIHMDSLGI